MRAAQDHPTPLEAAMGYAKLGYPTLPLQPGEKRPHPRLVPHGLKEASLDEATIRAWWREEPRAGVGILAPEGVLVLDVDAPEAWEALRGEYPALEAAPRQRTPKGGYHVFLRLPQGVRLSAAARKLPGVDLRGMGRAYVVAAPTRLGDGRGYAWEVPLVRPEELPVVPEGLLLRLLPPPPPPPPEVRPTWGGASPKRLRGLLEWACREVAATPPGNRHNRLLALARLMGGYAHLGLDPEEAARALAQAGVEAGLSWQEALRTAQDGVRYGLLAPLDLPAPTPPAPRTYRARLYARLRGWA